MHKPDLNEHDSKAMARNYQYKSSYAVSGRSILYLRFLAAILFVITSASFSFAAQSQVIRGAMVGGRSINPKDIALFASQHSNNRTAVIDSNNKILGYLTAPGGFLALGPQGNLYDVPFNNTDVLTIFHPPYKNVSVTIGFGEFTTVGVAVDQRTGTYAVTSIDYQNGGSGSKLSIYTHDDKLCLTIPQPPEGFFWGGQAFDREGRLLVLLGTGASSHLMGEISGGCNAKRIEFATLPSYIYPSSIIYINKQDNIVLQNGDDVLTFAHPTQGVFSPPLATTVLPHLSSLSCLTPDGQYLWAAILLPDRRRYSLLRKLKYPSGAGPVAQIQIDGAFSCATNPPLIP